MNLKKRIIGLVAATAIAVPAVAYGFSINKEAGESVVKIHGKLPMPFGSMTATVKRTKDAATPQVSIQENGDDLTINVALGAIKTGMDLRDKHFRQRMKNLAASLKVKTSDVKGKKGDGKTKGQLTLNGVTRPVDVKFNIDDRGGHLVVKGSIKDPNATPSEDKDNPITGINHYDFNIGKAFCEAGQCVKPNLVIEAELYVNK